MIFVLAALGIAMGGALWLASAVTFQPKTYFGVQWTAYMIFMVLVGGIGKFEGAMLGAIIFFVIETWFGATGVWYLIVLGGMALVLSLLLPKGVWGFGESLTGLLLLPVGYRVVARSNRRPRTQASVNVRAVPTGDCGADHGPVLIQARGQAGFIWVPSWKVTLHKTNIMSGDANMTGKPLKAAKL
jgi:hypothetical protein